MQSAKRKTQNANMVVFIVIASPMKAQSATTVAVACVFAKAFCLCKCNLTLSMYEILFFTMVTNTTVY